MLANLSVCRLNIGRDTITNEIRIIECCITGLHVGLSKKVTEIIVAYPHKSKNPFDLAGTWLWLWNLCSHCLDEGDKLSFVSHLNFMCEISK